MKRTNRSLGAAVAVAAACGGFALAADITLVQDGRARVVVCVPDGLMAADQAPPAGTDRDAYQTMLAEVQRRVLRDSVLDLCHYLERMSGAKVAWQTGAEELPDGVLPVLVGTLAETRFGPPAASYPFRQGWRLVVSDQGIGLVGESNLAASYALYEVLHQLGCRWFMPGDLGEHIPAQQTITLAVQDLSSTPSTVYRGIWQPATFGATGWKSPARISGNEPFNRRNRQGGLPLVAAHNLEQHITAEQLEAHPDWRAVIKGQPHPTKIKWTKPEVAQAIGDAIMAKLDKAYQPVYCLALSDSTGWDESEDPAFDAGDMEETLGVVSKTDRLLVLANRIAERVGERYPEVRFSLLIYVDYTRAPVREPVHPSVIPYIAPITYNRIHAMVDTNAANGTQLLDLVRGWQKAAPHLGFYWYGYNLSETWAPNPFISRWSRDLPILFEAKYPYWFPETMNNFESTGIGLYLGMRLAWNAAQPPEAIVDDYLTHFYGAAAEPMSRYWRHFDAAWNAVGDSAGAAWSYRRRFTPQVMAEARVQMDAALAACRTALEYRRVAMANESLVQFERFMKMMDDLAEGRFRNLEKDFNRWWQVSYHLGERYQPQAAFYERFSYRHEWIELPHGRAFRDANRIQKDFQLLTPKPLKMWRYCADPKAAAEAEGWFNPGFQDQAWAQTDVTVDTWSHLGYHNYYGTMVYRLAPKLPAIPKGKRVFLWLAGTDGSTKVFVNGLHVPWTTPAGEVRDMHNGYAAPVSFDITEALGGGTACQLTLICTRPHVNEVGTGGLLGPVVLYREK